ncbi:MAG: SIS domain-containing protein [Prochlorococcus marinus CUG1431]|uniref:SIS domain-containing protein n=1 Tax=Prochlorococcus marinus CUG1433 TaxID=2774506 RepID=A0A9D9BVL7_PROMR|nr:SIS domain-containing protein [Prochlorococcus marinus CUG1433]MBO6981208.1 SIS domain-containing protein [Prochlorococcus marinus CUG1431]
MHLEIKGFEEKFINTLKTKEWQTLQEDFINSQRIMIVGNGGNLAVADHAAIDVARLTNKSAFAPGSGILASSLIHETSHDEWVKNWVAISMRGIKEELFSETLIIGISSSGVSKNIKKALDFAKDQNIKTALITGKSPSEKIRSNTIILDVNEYHTGEVLTLMFFYQLIHGAGFNCPNIQDEEATSNRRIDYNIGYN